MFAFAAVLRLCALVAAATVLASAREVARWDNSPGESELNLTRSIFTVADCAKSLPADARGSLKTPPKEAFTINLTCARNVDSSRCKKVEKSLVAATSYIAAVLAVREPIVVKAEFSSFSPPAPNTLGQAGATAFFAGRLLLRDNSALLNDSQTPPESKDIYLFPQALVKQLDKDVELPLADSDIWASFNADYNFWFPGDPEAIKPDQADFSHVALHEIVHGLGFTTSWRTHLAESLLTPIPRYRRTFSGAKVVGWEPPIIFDRFLRTLRNNSAADFEQTAGLLRDHFTTSSSTSFTDSAGFDAAHELFKAASSSAPSVFFEFKDRSRATMFTSKDGYFPASSIGHLDEEKYKDTINELMRPVVEPGKTLDMRNVKDGCAGRPIGPLTCKILRRMGFPTRREPTVGFLEISDTLPNYADASSAASSRRFNFFTALSVVAVLILL